MPVPIIEICDGTSVHIDVHYYILASNIITTYWMLLSFLFAPHIKYLNVKHFIALFYKDDDCVEYVVNKDVHDNTSARMQARLFSKILKNGGVFIKPTISLSTRHNLINKISFTLTILSRWKITVLIIFR